MERRKSSNVNLKLLFACFSIIFAFTEGQARAATVSWNSAVNGNWSDGTKWSGGVAPTSADDVVINVSGTYTVTLDVDATVYSINLGGASGTQTLSATGKTLTLNYESYIMQQGSLIFSGSSLSGSGGIVNYGSVSSTGISSFTYVFNYGTFHVGEGSTVDVNYTLTNQSGGIVTIESYLNGTLNVVNSLNSGNGVTNYGVIELSNYMGAGSGAALNLTNGALFNGTGGIIDSLAGYSPAGARIIGAKIFNEGTINISSPLTLSKDSAWHTNNGTINVNENFYIVQNGAGAGFAHYDTINIAAGKILSVSGGTFGVNYSAITRGSGTLDLSGSAFTNYGTLEPGGAGGGTLAVADDLSLSTWSHISTEIGGITAGTQYDVLAVSGSALLGGYLDVSLINGFIPNAGDSFQILTYGSQTGAFNIVNLPSVTGKGWTINYNPTNVTLDVVADSTPPNGSISINSGDTFTGSVDVLLTLTCTDPLSGCSEMSFSDDNITWSTPETFSTYVNRTLPAGDFLKTVYAKFKDGAGNWSSPTTSVITLDTTPPTGTISINAGAGTANDTAVTLTLTCDDSTGSGCDQMMLSNDNITWSDLETYAPSKNWTLSGGNGTKTVYVQFFDKLWNTSPVLTDTIMLTDTTTPSVISVNPLNGATDVDVNTYITAAFSEEMDALTIDGSTFTISGGVTGSVSYDPSAKSAKFTPSANLASNTTYTVTITTIVQDIAMNALPANYTWSFTTGDFAGPTGTFSINSGAIYTNTTLVDLNLTCSDPGSGCDGVYVSGGESGNYYDYSTTIVFDLNLTSGGVLPDGDTTVNLKFKDNAGNYSDYVSDSIIVDRVPPASVGPWTAMTSGTTNGLNAVTYALSTFVAVGTNGKILTSSDGSTWIQRSSGTSNGLNDVTYANSIFVAVGDVGTVLTSADGITWTPRASGTTDILTGIAYGNSTFVAAGYSGSYSGNVYTSADGITWAPGTTLSSNPLKGVRYINSSFIALGWGAIFTSPDGTSWSTISSGAQYYNGIAYDNSTYVVVGNNGTILTSTDGVAWSSAVSGIDNPIYDITYANGVFVAVGDSGIVLTSPDGSIWTITNAGTSYGLSCIVFANSNFTVVGGYGSILRSWASFPDTVIINAGAATTTDPLVSLSLSCMDATSGCYQMQFSNDGSNWSTPESYAASKNWTLSGGSGIRKVYVKYMDNAGNWSGAYTGAITVLNPTLTVSKTGTGTGTVTSDIGGISCGATCSASYNLNDVVTLTAVANPGSSFVQWTGACTGTASTCQVTMGAAKNATAQFNVLTTINGATYSSGITTWTLANSPYYLTGVVTISAGATLVIEPGVIVKSSGSGFIVYGTLTAQGTAGNRIHFTDYRDDTVGGDTNGDGASTSPGSWGGINVMANGTASLDYCDIAYGGSSNAAVYKVGAGALSLTHSTISYSNYWTEGVYLDGTTDAIVGPITISNNVINGGGASYAYDGIYLKNAGSNVIISGNTIQNNRQQGIVLKNSSPTISDNTFSGNSYYGLYIAGTPVPNVSADNTFTSNGRGYMAFDVPAAANAHLYDGVFPGKPVIIDYMGGGNNTVTTNTLWQSNRTYYIYSGGVAVSSGATLTLQQGTILKFYTSNGVVVYGTLSAQGASGNKIYFTDYRDDSIGGDMLVDGPFTFTAGAGWPGITVNNNGSATLDYCEIHYGGHAIYKAGAGALSVTNSAITNSTYWSEGIYVDGSAYAVAGPITINNNVITGGGANYAYDGIYLKSAGSNITISDNTIQNNRQNGIALKDSSPTISGNTISGNSYYGLYVAGTSAPTISVAPVFSSNTYGAMAFDVPAVANANVHDAVLSSLPVIVDYLGGAGSSTVTTNTTWQSTRPYYFKSGVTVNSGATLTIQKTTADMLLKWGSASLSVYGNLQVIGSSAHNVYFTDYRDDALGGDTNGDGGTTTPSGWPGIWVYANGNAALDYCDIRYGGSSNGAVYKTGAGSLSVANSKITNSSYWGEGIYIDGATAITGPIAISNNIITGGGASYAYDGIYLKDAGSNITISGNTIQNNRQNGFIMKNSSPTISGNTITGNTYYGLYVAGSSAPTITAAPTFSSNAYGDMAYDVPAAANANMHDTVLSGLPVIVDYHGGVGSASVSANAVWQSARTYYFKTSPTVNSGVTLTIQNTLADIATKWASGTALTVNGNLQVAGSSAHMVYFTDYRDDSIGGDTNGSTGGTSPASGWWSGIYVSSGGSATLDYCSVRYGGFSSSQNVYKTGTGSLSLTNSTVSNSSNYGINMSSTTAAGTFSNNTITGNTYGVYMSNAGSPTMQSNNIYSNTSYGIYLTGSTTTPNIYKNNIYSNPVGIYAASSANPLIGGSYDNGNNLYNNSTYSVQNASVSPTINATYNYWGTSAGPYNATTNTGGNVNSKVSDYVNYSTYAPAQMVDGAPTVTGVTPTSAATNISISSAVSAAFSEAMDPAMISGATFTLSGVTGTVSYNVSTMTATFTPLANLAYGTTYTATITTGAKDLAGNPIAATYVWSFTTVPDVTPPTGTIAINSGAAYTSNVNAGLSLTCSDTGSGCSQMQISNDNFATSSIFAFAASHAWTLLAGDGVKTVYVKFQDGAGNWSSVYTASISIDTVAPAFISTAPAADAYANTANVGYTLNKDVTSGAITFTWTGGTNDPSPHVYNMTSTDMTAGTHTVNTGFALVNGAVYTVSFDATDAPGNAATVSNANVTFDATSASATIISPASNSIVNNSNIDYTLSEAVSSGEIEFARTSGASDGLSPHVYTLAGGELSSGSHNISTGINLVDGAVYDIRIKNVFDMAGNATTAVSNTGVTYDSAAVAITGATPGANAFINTATATYTLSEAALSGKITFAQTGGATDGGSPHVYNLSGSELYSGLQTVNTGLPLVDGAIYTVSFDATDMAGNAATTVSNANVTFDATAPAVTATSPLSGATGVGVSSVITATFNDNMDAATINVTNFTMSGGISGTVTYDSGTKTATLTPLSALAYSTNYNATITAAVKDIAGNATASDYVWSFTTAATPDITPPTGTISINSGALYTNSTAATLTLSCTDASGCSEMMLSNDGVFDTETAEAYSASRAWTLLTGYGVKTVYMMFKDAAGNWSVVYSAGITLDTIVPSFTSTSPSINAFINTSQVGYTLNKDVTSGTITFAWTGGSGDTSHVYNMTSTDITSGTHTVNTGFALVSGAVYTLSFDVTDAAGNAATVSNANVTFDATSASATINSPASSSIVNNSNIDYTLSEVVSSGEIEFAWISGTEDLLSPHIYTLAGGELSSGSHNISTGITLVDGAVYDISIKNVFDMAGNPTADVSNSNITYESAALAITGATPGANAIIHTATVTYTLSEAALSGKITFARTGGATDGGSPHVYNLSGLELYYGAHTVNTGLPLLDGAIYTVSFDATDMAENAATTVSNANVRFDATVPSITTTDPASDATDVAINSSITATFSEAIHAFTIDGANFTISGGVYGTITYNTGTKTATFTPSANLAYSTTYTATITTGVKDLAGNAMEANYAWSFTTASPAATNSTPTAPSLNSPKNGYFSSSSPVLVVNNATDANNDALTYNFEVYEDSNLTTLASSASGIAGGSGTTSWSPSSLKSDVIYYWRARAYDGKEFSSWSSTATFVISAGTITGDVDYDGQVDGYDLILMSVVFGKISTDSGFNPYADLNDDGGIDGKDLLIMAPNMGKNR